MDQTSQSADALAMTAEREAAQAAAILRGKEAAAQQRADARAVHAEEVARRNASDASMNIPARWPEPRKAAARAKYANQQRAAQVEAEQAANPGKKTNPAATRGWISHKGILSALQRGSAQHGMPFPKA